jgi:hypothetical protein
MKYSIFSVAVLFACGAPTDTDRLDVPTSVDFRIVHPAVVRVTVTPANGNAYPAGKVQYVAVARNGARDRPRRWNRSHHCGGVPAVAAIIGRAIRSGSAVPAVLNAPLVVHGGGKH